MQRIASTSALSVYYDDILYLESALLAAAEENVALTPLAQRASKSKAEIKALQQKETDAHEAVIQKRARSKFFDGNLDAEILRSGMTMEQAVNRDYSNPEYKLLFGKYSASDMVRLGVTRENQEVRQLLARAQSLPEGHPFRERHTQKITERLERSEKADQEYKQAQADEKQFYATAALAKSKINKERREIYVDLQKLFPHDKELVEGFFQKIAAPDADTEEETVEPTASNP